MNEEELKKALELMGKYPQHTVSDNGEINFEHIIGLIKDYAKWITTGQAYYKGRKDVLLQNEIDAIRELLKDGEPIKTEDYEQINKIGQLIEVLKFHFVDKGAFKYHGDRDSLFFVNLEIENPNFMDDYNRIGTDIGNSYYAIKELQQILNEQKGIGSCANEIQSILNKKANRIEIQPIQKLYWGGGSNQMYWTLKKLKEKNLINNSNEELAEFLRQCVDKFKDTAHITITTELSRGKSPTKSKRVDFSDMPENDELKEE